MPRSNAIAVGAGLVSSLLSSAAAIGPGLGLLLTYFSILPILLVGLSQGKKSSERRNCVGDDWCYTPIKHAPRNIL